MAVSTALRSTEGVSIGEKPNRSNAARMRSSMRCSTIRSAGVHSGNPLMGPALILSRRSARISAATLLAAALRTL